MKTNKYNLQYWMKMFPEVNDKDELQKIFLNVSGKTIQSLIRDDTNIEQNTNIIDIDRVLDHKKSDFLVRNSEEFLEHNPFFHFFSPFLSCKIEEFIVKVRIENAVDNEDEFVKKVIKHILDLMFEKAFRVLVLEVNIARLEGYLEGTTPEERLNYFLAVSLNDESFLKSVYKEYEVLTSLLCVTIDDYFTYVMEIIKNTKREISSLNSKFNSDNDLGAITNITTGLGDTHQKGKSVSTIYFKSGKKIIYKPRDLTLEQGFQEVLYWLDGKNIPGILNFKRVQIHTVNDSGWMEHIDYKSCFNKNEANDFYTRSGNLLCLLYLLNAVDFHHENLIAHGSFPVLVDLESLFHARLKVDQIDKKSAFVKATELVDNSVQSISLLPTKISKRVGDKDISLDIGGLGAYKEQLSPHKSLVIENAGTDTIKILRKNTFIKPQLNNPSIKTGSYLYSENYTGQIKDGFASLYSWVMLNKDEFWDKISQTFKETNSRFIFRPTYLYTQLLRISSHPDFMRDTYRRKIILHRIGIDYIQEYKDILNSEYKDLLTGDVPFFRSSIEHEHLIDSRGKKIYNILEEPPIKTVKQKIFNLSKEDLKRQIDFIEMSYISNEKRLKEVTDIKFSKAANLNKIKSENWIDEATQIGEFIVENSVCGINKKQKDRMWIGPSLEGIEEDIWNANVLGFDIYNGNSGIALFLGYLGEILNRQDFKQAAIETMRPMQKFISEIKEDHPYLIGAFQGISGYFYTLNKLSNLFEDSESRKTTLENISVLSKLGKFDKVYDLIGGSLGSLAVMLSIIPNITEENNKKEILKISHTHCDHILSVAKNFEEQISWPGKYSAAYSGFSHGNSGFIAYLYKFFKLTNDEQLLEVIQRALRFERRLYSEDHNNWYTTENKDKLANGWCHGAPGILLSKLILKDNGFEDEYIEKEISTAIDSSIHNGIGNNPTYCHGDLGVLSILNYASDLTNNINLKNRCLRTYQDLFENVLAKKWRKKDLVCTRSYSLMIGLSGIGYSMIKNYAPEIVPNFLWLE
ncbi:type 2 lanthipeptide synthetase LanM family protein [Bacillus subtilis]